MENKPKLIEGIAEILEQPCDDCELEDNCDCRVRGIVCPYQKKKADQVLNLLKEILKAALAQSRKGEEIDLPQDWFELFSAIQNEGVRKYHEHPDYDPQAVQVGWYIERGWLPPDEAERLKEEIRKITQV